MKYGVVRKSCRNSCLKQNLPCKGWRIQLTGKYAATFFSNNISVVSLNENLSAVKLVENISSNTSFIIKNSFDPIQRVEKHLKSWIHAHLTVCSLARKTSWSVLSITSPLARALMLCLKSRMEVTLGKLTSFPDRMWIRSDHVEAENVNEMKVPHVQITVASSWKRGQCTLT